MYVATFTAGIVGVYTQKAPLDHEVSHKYQDNFVVCLLGLLPKPDLLPMPTFPFCPGCCRRVIRITCISVMPINFWSFFQELWMGSRTFISEDDSVTGSSKE